MSKPVGRPPGSVKDPDLEIVKEQNAWLGRLRRSGGMMDRLLGGFQSELEECSLSRDARIEILQAIREAVQVQIKVITETQRIRVQGAPKAPTAEQEPLDLR